jgi:phage-related protein
MKYVKTFENFTHEELNENLIGGAIEKVKKWFTNEFESFVEKHPEVKEAFEKVKEAGEKLTEEDRKKLANIKPEDLSMKLENLTNGEKGMINEGLTEKIVTFLGLGTAGASFVSAVAALIKAAIGAGFYTFGLPVGVIVAICLSTMFVSGWIGKTAYDKI